jgi:putative chromate ion transporter
VQRALGLLALAAALAACSGASATPATPAAPAGNPSGDSVSVVAKDIKFTPTAVSAPADLSARCISAVSPRTPTIWANSRMSSVAARLDNAGTALGAVVYGSGYTLLAFIRDDFVLRLHWLTEQQALDAISIGQVTPGPVFTTATFIGYLVLGWQGALVATLGIFLPSFLFVPFIHLAATRLRRSRVIAAALAGANIAALALMTGVSLQLARTALVDLFTWGIALLSLVMPHVNTATARNEVIRIMASPIRG